MKLLQAAALVATLSLSGALYADDFVVDTKGSHASINFEIPHLGYSILRGRFNDFEGTFSFDEAKPEDTKVAITVATTSIDSNHADRDKHLRGEDFLDVDQFPEASFVSTAFDGDASGNGSLTGDLTLHGVTKSVIIEIAQVGAGKDPWGGFRRGFEGKVKLSLADFGINFNLGPASKEVTLVLGLEGVRQ